MAYAIRAYPFPEWKAVRRERFLPNEHEMAEAIYLCLQLGRNSFLSYELSGVG